MLHPVNLVWCEAPDVNQFELITSNAYMLHKTQKLNWNFLNCMKFIGNTLKIYTCTYRLHCIYLTYTSHYLVVYYRSAALSLKSFRSQSVQEMQKTQLCMCDSSI